MIQVHDKIGQHRGIAIPGHNRAAELAELGRVNGYRLQPAENRHVRQMKGGRHVLAEKPRGALAVTFAAVAW
jgi:hypothetical protein